MAEITTLYYRDDSITKCPSCGAEISEDKNRLIKCQKCGAICCESCAIFDTTIRKTVCEKCW